MFLKLYHYFLSPSTSFNLRWEEAIAEILQEHPAISRFAFVLTGLVIIAVSKAFSTLLIGHPGVWSVGWLFCRLCDVGYKTVSPPWAAFHTSSA